MEKGPDKNIKVRLGSPTFLITWEPLEFRHKWWAVAGGGAAYTEEAYMQGRRGVSTKYVGRGMREKKANTVVAAATEAGLF